MTSEFYVEPSDTSNYGTRFYVVGLPGKREVSLNADRMDSVDGTVRFYGRRYPKDQKSYVDYDNPTSEEHLVLVFPPGHWEFAYAASTVDGSPVCVQSWDAGPEADTV